VIDPDGVEQHVDPTSEMGEIGENAPSEANFDETMSIAEAQAPMQVTASSGALWGLDNGLTHPREGRTPEQGKAPGSAHLICGIPTRSEVRRFSLACDRVDNLNGSRPSNCFIDGHDAKLARPDFASSHQILRHS